MLFRSVCLPIVPDYNGHVFHIFPLFTEHRDALRVHLEEQEITTLIHYPIPVHKQECYTEYGTQSYPVAELQARTELSLPCHPAMSDSDVAKVIEAVNSFHI